MYCNNCGKKVEDGVLVCPACNTQLPVGVVQAPVQVHQPLYDERAVQGSKASGNPKAKGYAAIVSALLAFPALICLMIDYLGAPPFVLKVLDFFGFTAERLQQGNMNWSLYLLGFIMCVWMAAVLPAIKPKYPAITVCVCLTVISLYMLLLAFINDSAEWYTQWVLPIFLMITVSSAIMSVLISYKVIKGKHIAVAIGVQAALLSVGFEIVWDMNIRGEVSLRGSLIAAVTVIGLVIIYEAVDYAVRVNKK